MATDLNNSRPQTGRSRKYHRNRNMKITIESNKTLLEILDDKRKVMKLLIIIVVLAMTIFIGLSFVTVSIKSVYPYNSIKVNAFGTTTMQDEDREIHYWLFNTAELWANSGIYVEKGDILTIRSSGEFNTAIHHMVNAANSNNYNSYWIEPDGHEKDSDRGKLRAEFRICPTHPVDAIIMRVIHENTIRKYIRDHESKCFLTKNDKNDDNIYFIGKECVDLHIRNNGYLCFAVNDIVLTENVIKEMIARNDSLIRDAIIDSVLTSKACLQSRYQKFQDVLKIDSIECANGGRKATKQDIYRLLEKSSIKCKTIDSLVSKDEVTWRKFNAKFLDFGPYPGCKKDEITKDSNEMTYYKKCKCEMKFNNTIKDTIGSYFNAWFDDNLGSFLIVVEHKKSKP